MPSQSHGNEFTGLKNDDNHLRTAIFWGMEKTERPTKASTSLKSMMGKSQLGASRAQNLAAGFKGSYVKAHRNWLMNFIDEKIDLTLFADDSKKVGDVRNFRDLPPLVGGKRG